MQENWLKQVAENFPDWKMTMQCYHI